MNPPSRVSPASHANDSLVLPAERLGEAALRCAARQPAFLAVDGRSDLPWMATSFQEGRFILHTRSIRQKYLYRLEHPAFDTLVSLGFDPMEQRAIGVVILGFRGRMEECGAFMTELADWFRRGPTPPPTFAYEH